MRNLNQKVSVLSLFSFIGALILLASCVSLPEFIGPIGKKVSAGDIEGVKAELDAGVSPNMVDERAGMSLLAIAIRENKLDMARYLVSRGARAKGDYFVGLYSNFRRDKSFSKYLIKEAKMNPDEALSILVSTPFDEEYAKFLIKVGGSLESPSNHPLAEVKETKLNSAVLMALHNFELEQLPVYQGPEYESLRESARKLTRWSVKTALQLISLGANPNARTKKGEYPLTLAARMQDLSLVSALIKAGAKVNSTNKAGLPPLQIAAANGNKAFFDALVAAGANPQTKNSEGKSAIQVLAEKQRAQEEMRIAQREAARKAEQEEEESGFQWGKFAALATGAAIAGVDKLNDEAKVQALTAITADSMPGQRGVQNTQALTAESQNSVNGGAGGAKKGSGTLTEAQKKAAKNCANEYKGPDTDPQPDSQCKLAAFDACLHRVTGLTTYDQEGRAACATLDGLLKSTTSKGYHCPYCPYPY